RARSAFGCRKVKRTSSGLGDREGRHRPSPPTLYMTHAKRLLGSPTQSDGRPAAQRAGHLLAPDGQLRYASVGVPQPDGIFLNRAAHVSVVVSSARKRAGEFVVRLL